MKGKLIIEYNISENEILAKDTEIEITNIYSGYNSNFYKGIVGDREVVINANAIEITDCSPIINWEQRRYEIAKDILAAYNILNNGNGTEYSAYINAKCAIVYADALIKLLKEHN